ncbi:endonuclease domain-containing protein [Stakelama saccharophila]|uniref:Endonuclease domain-containing protein n=1 Tax=Stakelama saccharophila TaxID=3075605 RepID=A0ABZ0B8Y6_9SPHN|nr:endonuclease domain-containing protein [Stakelama sp. W311]WNO53581.1 endonuclease domain-containing protein [Stakelama sp. W311]
MRRAGDAGRRGGEREVGDVILPGTGRGTAPAGRGGGGVPPARRPEVVVARKLRRKLTLPEAMLWRRLRGGATGVKFRRQHPIGPYIVDFYCPRARLAIEIDGSVHDGTATSERDASRDRFLSENGYRVVRIGANDVMRDLDATIASIVSLAAVPLHHASHGPPPRAGED